MFRAMWACLHGAAELRGSWLRTDQPEGRNAVGVVLGVRGSHAMAVLLSTRSALLTPCWATSGMQSCREG